MARKHIEWQESGNGLCGKPMLPTTKRDLNCMNCLDLRHVMTAARAGAEKAGLEATFTPEGSNGCRVSCDTSTPQFRAFATAMRRGIELNESGHVYTFSVRGKTDSGAVVR